MDDVSAAGRYFRSLLFLLAALASTFQAQALDTYNPASGGELQIPTLAIGDATYSDVVVTVASVVSGPTGKAPVGTVDTYNPSTTVLTVPAVQVGGATYYNAVVTVGQLESIGSVSGADTYDGTHLVLPYVQAGLTTYTNVVLSVTSADIVTVHGGMPGASLDHLDADGHLIIGAVQAGSTVYTNVVLAVGAGNVVSVGGISQGPGPAGVTALVATASAATIPSDGSQTVQITVLALNAADNTVPNVPLSFAANNGGALTVTQATTNASGAATATLSAPNGTPGALITVRVTYGSVVEAVLVQVVAPMGPPPPASLQVNSSAASITADGAQSALITVFVLDARNNLLSGQPVAFSATTGGALQVTQGTTGPNGEATATLTALGAQVGTQIVVTVTAGNLAASVTVLVVAPTG